MQMFKRWQNGIYAHLEDLNRFGSARWARTDELTDLTEKRGLYIGGGIYTYPKQGHLMTVAGTRGGKGVNLIIPNLLGLGGYEGSWFVIDVKGEATAITARYQREKGQDVLILDPWGIHTKQAATYNPLDLLAHQNDPDHLIDNVSVIAEMIVPKETAGDQFWNNKARSLISGLILHLMVGNTDAPKTLATIWQWLRLPEEEWEKLLVDMAVSDNAIIRATANEFLSIIHAASKMFLSILASAQDKTDFLKSPSLQKSLASSNFDIRNLSNGKTTFYVIIPPDKLDSHYQWLRLVLTTAMRSVVQNRNKKVTFLIDEFPALGYLSEAKIALSTYAGYNIIFWPIIQDLTQLKNLYFDAWETFMSNTAVRQFFSVSDNFSLEYLSKLMGQSTTVTYEMQNGVRKPNATARPLITPDEIRRGSADNMFTIIEQRPPTILPKKPYYDIPQLDGRYDDNPYYKTKISNGL
jgi:type IV secretion system protein VirD4